VAYDALEAVRRLLSGKKYDLPAPDNDAGRSEEAVPQVSFIGGGCHIEE